MGYLHHLKFNIIVLEVNYMYSIYVTWYLCVCGPLIDSQHRDRGTLAPGTGGRVVRAGAPGNEGILAEPQGYC